MAAITLPRRLLVGGGTVKQLGGFLKQMGYERPLVVTDPFLASGASTALSSVSASLEAEQVRHDIFTDTIPDPTTDSVDKLVQCIKQGGAGGAGFDSIVALGGGSPMDSAKAAGVLATYGGHMRDYKAPYAMDMPSMPIIAIPTTAGTGSEATKVTIITDSESEEKMLCMGMAYLPTAAVVDYELTLSKPWRLTADTGIDALCHAMEAYVSVKHNLFSDAIALQSLTAIGTSLQTCCYHPDDHAARERMMLASTHAGMAFSNSSVTLIHGMSRPVGARYHVPHGLSNAMLAPAITSFSLGGAVDRYAHVARALGMCPVGISDSDAADHLCKNLYALNAELKVPSLTSWTGVAKADFLRDVPGMAAAALASGSPNNNPVIPTQAEIEGLYKTIFAEQ